MSHCDEVHVKANNGFLQQALQWAFRLFLNVNSNWHNAFRIPQMRWEKVIKCPVKHRCMSLLLVFIQILVTVGFYFNVQGCNSCNSSSQNIYLNKKSKEKLLINVGQNRCAVFKHKCSFLSQIQGFIRQLKHRVGSRWGVLIWFVNHVWHIWLLETSSIGEKLYLITIESKAQQSELSNNLRQLHHHEDMARTSGFPSWCLAFTCSLHWPVLVFVPLPVVRSGPPWSQWRTDLNRLMEIYFQ